MSKSQVQQTVASRVRSSIASKTKLSALGNDNRSLKDLAVDLIHDSGMPYDAIADGCYLCNATVKNLAQEVTRWPRADTVERIIRYFEVSLSGKQETLKSKFRNQPK